MVFKKVSCGVRCITKPTQNNFFFFFFVKQLRWGLSIPCINEYVRKYKCYPFCWQFRFRKVLIWKLIIVLKCTCSQHRYNGTSQIYIHKRPWGYFLRAEILLSFSVIQISMLLCSTPLFFKIRCINIIVLRR